MGSWKTNINLEVAQLKCEYKDHYNFKSLTVVDQLTVSGDIPTDLGDKTITFKNNADANDLVAKIKSDSNVENFNLKLKSQLQE